MKDIRYIWRGAAFSLALSLMAAGCSMTDDYVCPADEGGTPGSGSAFIQLSFGMADARGTRANPDGGEQGNGSEAGQTDENAVSNAVAFLFDGNVTVNGAATTPVTPVYFSTVTPKQTSSAQGVDAVYTTAPVHTTLENGTYNVIVVANPGDDKWWDQSANQTLGQVRDHIQKAAWKEGDNGTYSDFLMSLADEVTQKLVIKNNPEDDPATTTVNVERMAARVDYIDGRQNMECTDPRYQGATVEITGATIVNRLTAGSYLLKRVADDVDGRNLEYLGYELPLGVDAGVQTNYVLDPWTALKTQANLAGTPFTVEEQPAAASDLYDPKTYIPTRSDNPEDWADYCKAGVDATEDDYLRVGYALENTTGKLETSLNYNTGIVFKAQFHPEGMTNYTDGQTFFTYNGEIYPTLTDMMGQLNGQEYFSTYVGKKIAALKSWDDLKDFAASITNDPTGYSTYLEEYADTHSAEAFNKSNELKWEYYLSYKLGVSENSQDGPEINQNEINTRNVLFKNSGEKLRTYYKGQCYYIWWLRHSNDGDDEKNGVMEYAVVRNNIYKVSVNSIYSLGGDIPDNEGLDAQVYVNKWSMLPEETLPM
jgi:hypothetical protein